MRSEFGYERNDWDLAFQAFKEGVKIEHARSKFLRRRAVNSPQSEKQP